MNTIQNILTINNIKNKDKLQSETIELTNSNLSEELEKGIVLPSEINSNSESINIFANDTEPLYIENTEIVPKFELLYDDEEIYIRDLENHLLSKRDINDQSFKYIQDEVKTEVMKIIEIKKIGDKIFKNLFDNNINLILNNKFNEIKWIIPVLNDKQVFFTKITEDDKDYIESDIENPEDEIYTTLSDNRDPNGLKIYDQRIHLIKLTELENDFESGKYNLTEYLLKKNDILKTFEMNYNKTGYIITADEHFSAMRYFDINNIHWQQRFVNEPIFTQIEVKDEKKQKFIQKNLLVPGEKCNIIGFIILGNNQNTIYNIFDKNSRIGKIGFYGDIQEIITGKNTKIIMNNHNLKSEEEVYIDNSNSIPEVNGVFKITVISNNEFYINIDTSNGTNGTYGKLYKNLKLNLKTYNVNKKLEIASNFNRGDLSEAKLILFNTFQITQKDLENILPKIIPTGDEIIQNFQNQIETISFVSQLNKLLNKYNIKYNDLNVEQYNFIKGLINTKPKYPVRVLTDSNIVKIYNKVNQRLIEDPLEESIYSYKNFNNPEIKKYYGDYPLYMSVNDSLANRILWIESHIDKGEIFYNIILRNINKNSLYKNKKKDIDDINNILAKIKEPVGLNLLNNYKVRIIDIFDSIHDAPTNISPPLPSDKILVNNILYNISFDGKKTSYTENTDSWEEGDRALYIQPLYSEEYIYKGKWKFSKKIDASYRRLVQFCNTNYSLFKDNKCLSQSDIDLIYEVNDLKNLIVMPDNINEKLNKLIEVYKKIIEIRKENLIYTDGVQVEDPENTGEEEIAITVKRILDLINNIKNDEIKLYLLNKIITFDGLTIQKKIYSKKYGSYIICGHYHYLISIFNTDDNDSKNNLYENMISEYGDDGDNDTSNIYCKICSTIIGVVKGDDVVGFDTQGHAIRENDLLDSDIIKNQIYMETKRRNGEIIRSVRVNDKSFINYLTNLNIKIDDVTLTIINTIDTMTMKTGTFIKREDYYQVIIDCYPYYNNLYNYNDYKRQQIKILKSKGQSDNTIKKLDDKKYFKDTYDRYINENKYSIVAARLLISYETAILEYANEKKNTGCVFYGYSSKDDVGINYFSCIINELDKNIKNANFSIRRNYDKFRRMRHINELFQLKYKATIQRKQVFKDISLKYSTIVNINSIINSNKVPNRLNKNDVSLSSIYSRYFYISHFIIKEVESIISKSVLLDPLGFTANVSCDSPLENYTNYYQYFRERSEKINEYIEESKDLKNRINKVIMKGNISRIFMGGYKDNYTNIYIQLLRDGEISRIIYYKDSRYESIDYTKIVKKLDIEFVRSMIDNYFKLLQKRLGNLYNVKKINSVKENIVELVLKMRIETIHIIKTLFNNYFRRFISIIKNHKNKAKDINKIVFTDSETSKIIQEQIYNNNIFLDYYLSNSKDFEKIYFENSFTDIENISLEDYDNTIYLLNSILFTELNKFSTIGTINVNKFILEIFEKFIEDYNDLHMNENDYKKVITTIKAKMDGKSEESKLTGEIDHKVSLYDDMSDEFEQEIKDNYKDEYMKKYGKVPTEDEIELYKEDFQDQLVKDKDTYDEFYMKQPKEGNEVLEVGDDFGEMPQGTENEGDGVPDIIDNYDEPNYNEED